MNIAILSYHRIGGSGVVAYETGRAMAEKGHNVHFIGLEPPFRLRDNFIDNLHFHKVWVHEYPVFNFPPYSLALASQLSEIINEYDIDVIHSHYALPHAVSAVLAREISGRDIKCVTTLHGTDITIVGAHSAMRNITKYAIDKSDVVTAVSHHLKKQTEDFFNIERDRIKVVYNFINKSMFNPDLRKECRAYDGKTVILHMSNLRPVKSPLDVIRIFHSMSEKVDKNLELWIVGEGPMRSEMLDLSRHLKIDKKVNFLGIKNTVGPVVASADLLLVTSTQESFGLTVLEAMSCGVPVLASRVGGIPEVVDDGRSGLLFEQGNIEDAASKGAALLQDKATYESIKNCALETATGKFSRNAIISQFEEIYNCK